MVDVVTQMAFRDPPDEGRESGIFSQRGFLQPGHVRLAAELFRAQARDKVGGPFVVPVEFREQLRNGHAGPFFGQVRVAGVEVDFGGLLVEKQLDDGQEAGTFRAAEMGDDLFG